MISAPQLEHWVQLSGISWETYDRLQTELRDRRLRLTFHHGVLDIMAPSAEHEYYKKVVGRFVETIAEELKINLYPLGSTTLNRPDIESGAEPDECFYVQNLAAIQGKTRINLAHDPVPDLVIEIDITSRSDNRMTTYAALGIPELWRYDGATFTVWQLQAGQYLESDRSLAFPTIPVRDIAQFLQRATTTDYLELVRQFRAWVQQQLDSDGKGQGNAIK